MTADRRMAELAVGGPGVAAAILLLTLLAALAIGAGPFRPGAAVTLAEAAALEDEADIVRLTRAGADPDAPGFVRRTRLRAVNQMLTPLEAAVTSRHGSVMRLLLESGASLDSRNFPTLWCFAEQRRNEEVLALLREYRPGGGRVDCSKTRVPSIAP